jgi:hypothetical protein
MNVTSDIRSLKASVLFSVAQGTEIRLFLFFGLISLLCTGRGGVDLWTRRFLMLQLLKFGRISPMFIRTQIL